MAARSYISFKEKLAAVLCQSLVDDGAGRFVPRIPHDEAKLLTAEQVLSLFQWDHYPKRKADGGTDEHHNLMPRFIQAHRIKTATIDQPQISKRKRIARANDAAVNRLLARERGDTPAPSRWPSRKIQSRGFQQSRPRAG